MRRENKKEIDTKISNEEFEKYIDKIFAYMKEKLLEKNRVYGSASFEGGRMAVIGNAFRQRDKSNRQMHLIKTLVEEGKSEKPFGESLWDTICDQFGYSVIGLTLLAILGESGSDFNQTESMKSKIPENLSKVLSDAFGYDPRKDGIMDGNEYEEAMKEQMEHRRNH